MPNARLPMNHARKILRLSREMKMSGRAIAKSLSQVLEKEKTPSPSSRVEPDWGQVHRELQSHKGGPLHLHWEEYG